MIRKLEDYFSERIVKFIVLMLIEFVNFVLLAGAGN